MPKILIIDYEPRSIKQLSDPLEDAGHEILVAKDGIVGLEVFRKEEPDLVLIEAMLPRRVVTSVYKGRKYRSQAIHQHGADEYLEKPIAPATLTKTVEGLLPDRSCAARQPATPAPAAVLVATVPEVAAAPQVAAPVTTPIAAPVATPKAAPVPATPASGSVAATDATEAEIVEHLNEILGDPTGGSGSAG
jgi:CheY-like chemotaxis protein